MYNNILIPVALDHEAIVMRKLETARHLLSEGGRITLLTVLENIPGFVSEFVDLKLDNHLSQKVIERLKSVAGSDDAIDCQVATGKPGVQIAQHASDNGIDLIVVGSHHPSATDYFLGSTASRVVRRAGCSVFVVRD
ncbi:MAG: universal stress protein [Roseibium sp.]